MLLIALDRKGPEPVYRQIAGKIQRLIETEVIREGEILPPTRRLARQLNVSRYTVYCAYQELWARGFLTSSPGSYSRVRGKLEGHAPRSDARPGARLAGTQRVAAAAAPGLIDLGSYRLEERLFPMRELRKALLRVSGDENAALLQRADPAGCLPLRRTIAARLRSHSVPAGTENILITNGALHGLDLCFRLLASGGGKVILEEPTFSTALDLCRLHGVVPVGVPLRQDGMDLGILRRTLAAHKDLKFLFIIPTFQNPSGITTSRECREEIIALCASRGLLIVEDAFEEEMAYFGNVVLPLKSMDPGGSVLSLGTFSKVLFPGPRVGWITAEARLVEKLSMIRSLSDDGGSLVMQAALNELCESGAYQRHLELVNKVCARRMRAALDALSRFVPPEKASWTTPNGGFLIWLTLAPTDLTEEQLRARLVSCGVDARSGSGFFARPQKRLHLRLSISAHAEEEIVEGMRRLGQALQGI